MKKYTLRKNQTVCIQTETIADSTALTAAIKDLVEDLYGVLKITKYDNAQTVFRFCIDESIQKECYSLTITENVICFSGGDTLGLLWGIYDLCENVLNVNPFRKFLDLSYREKTTAEIEEIHLSPFPAFKYRGWFFNDEDYITGWRTPSGKRPVDYLFYSNIMNHKTVDELVETILRSKLNLMIPSSFLNIDVVADEENIRRITERGLYVSQHHIEPLGVSHFTFTDYFKRKGKEVIPSYYSSPEAYDEIWRHYIKKWAKYKNVIWQIGLRGKLDRPVWKDDPSIKNSEEFAGQLISKALVHQLNIIKEITNDKNPIATMTLWEEGAELYRKGYLSIPQGVTVVFTNWPRTQLMRPDYRQITRCKEYTYGAYHHTGSFCAGPHAVQGQKLSLMRNLFKTLIDNGDNEFMISNVQNLREVVYGAYAMTKFAFNGIFASEEELSYLWCRSISPEKAQILVSMYSEFYNTFTINNWDDYTLEGTTYWFDGFIRLAGLFAIDKYMKNVWDNHFTDQRADAYVREMKECYDLWTKTQEKIYSMLQEFEGEEKTFVTDNLYVQASIIKILSHWAYLINKAICEDRNDNRENAVATASEAIAVLKKIFDILPIAEHGKFTGWYNLEDKFDYKLMIKTSEDLLHFLSAPKNERVYWEDLPGTSGNYILNYKYHLG